MTQSPRRAAFGLPDEGDDSLDDGGVQGSRDLPARAIRAEVPAEIPAESGRPTRAVQPDAEPNLGAVSRGHLDASGPSPRRGAGRALVARWVDSPAADPAPGADVPPRRGAGWSVADATGRHALPSPATWTIGDPSQGGPSEAFLAPAHGAPPRHVTTNGAVAARPGGWSPAPARHASETSSDPDAAVRRRPDAAVGAAKAAEPTSAAQPASPPDAFGLGTHPTDPAETAVHPRATLDLGDPVAPTIAPTRTRAVATVQPAAPATLASPPPATHEGRPVATPVQARTPDNPGAADASPWRHRSDAGPAGRPAPYVPARSAVSPTDPSLTSAPARRASGAGDPGRAARGQRPPATRGRRLPLLVGAGVLATGALVAAASALNTPGGAPALVAVPATAAPPTGVPSGTPAAASATPNSVATTYAAGAFAVPQTGGVRLVPTASGPLSGKVIVLDPGHNGQFKYSINERSSYTFGAGYRPCVQGGTTTAKGVTEHEIVWQIANRVAPLLLAQGATVVLTRADDSGIGPCNSERPEIANREGASLFLSIHVDGNTTTTLRGFHVTWSPLMAGGTPVSQASEKAAQIVSDAMLAGTKLPGSNYMQTAGVPIITRTDLSVLDGVRGAPAVLIETGNGRNPDDEAILTTDAGQQSVAAALASAAEKIVTTLPANTAAGPASASPSAPPGASTPTAAHTP